MVPKMLNYIIFYYYLISGVAFQHLWLLLKDIPLFSLAYFSKWIFIIPSPSKKIQLRVLLRLYFYIHKLMWKALTDLPL